MTHSVPDSISVDRTQLTVPPTRGVLAALRAWEESQVDSLAAALAPFGLSPHAFAPPEWRRIVTPDDVAIGGAR